jgi:hypothetical protein
MIGSYALHVQGQQIPGVVSAAREDFLVLSSTPRTQIGRFDL